jgi:hypothetical protein
MSSPFQLKIHQKLAQEIIDLEALTSSVKITTLPDEQLLRINIGQEWWVEMNQTDLATFLGRRKAGESSYVAFPLYWRTNSSRLHQLIQRICRVSHG